MIETKKILKCDYCQKEIGFQEGITILGNIDIAQVDGQGAAGLIGDNFAKAEFKMSEDGTGYIDIKKGVLERTVDLCAECFLEQMTSEFKEKLKLALNVNPINIQEYKTKCDHNWHELTLEEINFLPKYTTYMTYVVTEYPYEKLDKNETCLATSINEKLFESYKQLVHHKDTTFGLWATDRPDLLKSYIKEDKIEAYEKLIFQITD